jgi:hypothetical protein
MTVEGIEYVYMETRNFGKSARFWQRLGFELVLDLGTSGKLEPGGGGAAIFLEEVSPETPLASGIYLKFDDPTMEVDIEIERVGAPIDTHWGTRLQTIRDPDGREIMLQHTLPRD